MTSKRAASSSRMVAFRKGKERGLAEQEQEQVIATLWRLHLRSKLSNACILLARVIRWG
jgi:hypothetical protein